MALSLPNPGQHPWAVQLNSALEQLDEQTVVDGEVVGDNLVLTKNDGTTVNAGSVRGPQGAPGGSDEAFAGFISNPETETGQALSATVAPVVAGIMANDPTIAEAAAERALSSAGLSLVSDPGVPNSVPTNRDADYAEAVIDMAGNVSEATGLDGVKVLPQAEVATARFENRPGVENPYVHVTVDQDGNIAEDALGLDGRTPSWVLEAWKGRMGLGVTGTDVLIVAGQSNATERSSLPVSVADADPRVIQWNHATGTADVVSATSTEWIGNAFAREYLKSNPNRRVLIVPAANGSTGFTTTTISPPPAGYHVVTGESGKGTWDRTLTADPVNQYAQMIAKAQAAISWAGANVRVVGVLWSQGESDRTYLTEAQYAAKLDDLIVATRAALGVPGLPFIIGSMTPEQIWDNSGGTAAINAALLDTPRRVPSTSYVWGPPNMVEYLNSRVHWAPQGQAERARVMATDGLYRARLNVASSKPVQAQNLRIERSGSQAVIRWNAPPCRVTSYALETSTDSGVTWVAATLAGPIITEHAMTVTPTLPLWARVKTTNDVGTTDWTREAKA